MTIRERMLAIRLIDKMENQYQEGMECITKENGVLKYTDEQGNVLIEASMKMRES